MGNHNFSICWCGTSSQPWGLRGGPGAGPGDCLAVIAGGSWLVGGGWGAVNVLLGRPAPHGDSRLTTCPSGGVFSLSTELWGHGPHSVSENHLNPSFHEGSTLCEVSEFRSIRMCWVSLPRFSQKGHHSGGLGLCRLLRVPPAHLGAGHGCRQLGVSDTGEFLLTHGDALLHCPHNRFPSPSLQISPVKRRNAWRRSRGPRAKTGPGRRRTGGPGVHGAWELSWGRGHSGTGSVWGSWLPWGRRGGPGNCRAAPGEPRQAAPAPEFSPPHAWPPRKGLFGD